MPCLVYIYTVSNISDKIIQFPMTVALSPLQYESFGLHFHKAPHLGTTFTGLQLNGLHSVGKRKRQGLQKSVFINPGLTACVRVNSDKHIQISNLKFCRKSKEMHFLP